MITRAYRIVIIQMRLEHEISRCLEAFMDNCSNYGRLSFSTYGLLLSSNVYPISRANCLNSSLHSAAANFSLEYTIH